MRPKDWMDSKSFDIPRCVENIFCCLCMDEQQNISSLFFKIEVAGHDQHHVVGQLSDGNAPFIFCKIGNMKVAKEKKIAKKT